MLNNKGQSSSIFLIIFPLIFGIGAFFFDMSVKQMNITRLEQTSYNIIKDVYTNSYPNKKEIIKEMLEKNKIDTEKLDFIELEENVLVIFVSNSTESFLGKLVGTNQYIAECRWKVTVDGENFTIEKYEE